MDHGHAPAGLELVADAGIDEEQVVVEVCDDGDKGAGAAIGWRWRGVRRDGQKGEKQGPRERPPDGQKPTHRCASAHALPVSALGAPVRHRIKQKNALALCRWSVVERTWPREMAGNCLFDPKKAIKMNELRSF
ncbi:hypothetical protein BRPE64_ACDS20780 [Caballeronia insecticola]|uniref:Uncharacterized protein n=1 Tax=Caballeronia insecticola TaxID=758793 RepID=R4WZH3_9BURK|nr:hypothetical protein BRPE64_ACDS20780 [Caballeronia insecticola]